MKSDKWQNLPKYPSHPAKTPAVRSCWRPVRADIIGGLGLDLATFTDGQPPPSSIFSKHSDVWLDNRFPRIFRQLAASNPWFVRLSSIVVQWYLDHSQYTELQWQVQETGHGGWITKDAGTGEWKRWITWYTSVPASLPHRHRGETLVIGPSNQLAVLHYRWRKC